MPEGKRRIMESFDLREISAVRIPAQTPARAAIIKSASFDTTSDMPPLDKLEADLEALRKEPDKPALMQLMADCDACYQSHMARNGGLDAFMRSEDFQRIDRVHRTAAALMNASGRRTTN